MFQTFFCPFFTKNVFFYKTHQPLNYTSTFSFLPYPRQFPNSKAKTNAIKGTRNKKKISFRMSCVFLCSFFKFSTSRITSFIAPRLSKPVSEDTPDCSVSNLPLPPRNSTFSLVLLNPVLSLVS